MVQAPRCHICNENKELVVPRTEKRYFHGEQNVCFECSELLDYRDYNKLDKIAIAKIFPKKKEEKK